MRRAQRGYFDARGSGRGAPAPEPEPEPEGGCVDGCVVCCLIAVFVSCALFGSLGVVAFYLLRLLWLGS